MLQRYALRSSTKSKEHKPDAPHRSNSSEPKRYFQTKAWFALSLLKKKIGPGKKFTRFYGAWLLVKVLQRIRSWFAFTLLAWIYGVKIWTLFGKIEFWSYLIWPFYMDGILNTNKEYWKLVLSWFVWKCYNLRIFSQFKPYLNFWFGGWCLFISTCLWIGIWDQNIVGTSNII